MFILFVLVQSIFLFAAQHSDVEEIEKLWPTITTVEVEFLLAKEQIRAPGFYNGLSSLSKTQADFLKEQLLDLGGEVLKEMILCFKQDLKKK